MKDTCPNPRDFHNTDKTLALADNYHKIVYYGLNEIAMGGPIGGQCFLENTDNKKVKIHDGVVDKNKRRKRQVILTTDFQMCSTTST